MKNGKMLEGVKVVELAGFIAAPCSAKMLADWGADVVKVEPIQGDAIRGMGPTFKTPATEDENPMFELENGNKRGVAINIKKEEGLKALHKLISEADVFLTNVRTGALKKIGLSYEQIADKYPGLIFAQILGYGEEGPDKDRPGFDYTAYFARGGVTGSLMQKGESPLNPAAGFGDHYAGVALAAGVNAALYKKKSTGLGEKVTVSLLQIALFGMGTMITTALYDNEMPISRLDANSPLLNTYKCKDGKWIQLALVQYDKWLPKFFKVIEREELLNDERFNTAANMVNHVAKMIEVVGEAMLAKDLDEWSRLLEEADLPFERIQTCAEILKDEQAWANDYLFNVEYANGNKGVLVKTPVSFKKMGKLEERSAPRIGEHTEEVLKEVGYDEASIKKLKEEKAIK